VRLVRYLLPGVVWGLTVADLLLTLELLELGATEANPVALGMLSLGTTWLAVWKLCWVAAMCALLVYLWPRAPRFIAACTGAAAVVYFGLVMYELGGLAAL
jgi:hypothetical protein